VAAIVLPLYAPGRPAASVDASLRQALAVLDRARKCAVLWFAEIQRRELYRELGFPSLEVYATQQLGFSRNRFLQFRRLAGDLERLPRLREAVERGEIGWTKAQLVTRAATEATEEEWVDRGRRLSRRELAAEVKRARDTRPADRELGLDAPAASAADPPTTLTFRLDGLQLARYEALIEQVHKRRLVPRDADRTEILLTALATLVEGGEGLRRRNGPPARVVVQRCPECERTAAVTRQGERRLSEAQAAAVMCDAEMQDGRGRTRATIPPSVRAAVLARDRHRCTTSGCGATRFLEVHHVVPRRAGGSNRADNLVTLCNRCHRFAHDARSTPSHVDARISRRERAEEVP